MAGSQTTFVGINHRRGATRLSIPNLIGAEGLFAFNIADHDVARMNLIPGKAPLKVSVASLPLLNGFAAQFSDTARFYDSDIVQANAMTVMAIVQLYNRAQAPVILSNRISPNLRGTSTFGLSLVGTASNQVALSLGTTDTATGGQALQETCSVIDTTPAFHLLCFRHTTSTLQVDNLSESTPSGVKNALTAGSVFDIGTRKLRIGSSYDGFGSLGACSIHTLAIWSRYLPDGERDETAKWLGQVAAEDSIGYIGPSWS